MKIQYEDDGLVVFESDLFRTCSSLIKASDHIIIVDPNWLPREVNTIFEQAQKYGENKEKYLLFTHSDYDHIIGYNKFKNYKTIGSANFVSNPNKEAILNQIKEFDDEYYITRDYQISYPVLDIVIAEDNFELEIGTDKYIFYQSLGHNSDGIITYNKSKGMLIAGDYLSNIEFPYVYDSFENYKNTLAKFTKIIENEDVKILITGHGDYTKDKAEMQLRIKESYDYIYQLKSALLKQTDFDLDKLFARYKFPIGMAKFHAKNIEVLQKEMQNKNRKT